MSTQSSNNVQAGSETYGSVMQKIHKQSLVNRAVKIQSKEKDYISRDEMAKRLDVSTATLSRAFKEKQDEQDEIENLKSIVMKSLGIATPLVLLETDAIPKISDKLANNPIGSGLIAGGYVFWQQFVKPQIDDPKNDLSELEVFIEIVKSNAGQVYFGGLLSSFTLPILLDEIKEIVHISVDKIATALMNFGSNVAEDAQGAVDKAKQTVGLSATECNDKTFPSFGDWFTDLPSWQQVAWGGAVVATGGYAAPVAYAAYTKEKLAWKKANCE